MSRKIAKILSLVLVTAGFWYLTGYTTAQTQGNPQPTNLNRPGLNHSEANGCTSCHFSRGAGGDHMLEAVGVAYNDDTKVFSFTGNGWFASKHAYSNYGINENTYCAKCHSPLQAKVASEFVNGFLSNTALIPKGQFESVTCASCHPSRTSAIALGRRLGIYQFEQDKSKPEAYKVIQHGEEDSLCLNCHVTRHNESNPGFKRMYDAGVLCQDCHLAPYGKVLNSEVEKRFHDFKVASNLPFSCGAAGSMTGCHTEFSAEATKAFLPYFKEQHKEWWPKPSMSRSTPGTVSRTLDLYPYRDNQFMRLQTTEDYYRLWWQLELQQRYLKGQQ